MFLQLVMKVFHVEVIGEVEPVQVSEKIFGRNYFSSD